MSDLSESEKKALDLILPNWGQTETPMTELTVARLEELSDTAFQLKAELDELDRKAARTRDIYGEVTKQIQEYLNFHGKEKYTAKSGTLDIRKKLSFKVPRTVEEKGQFFAWLDSKNIRMEYLTVNSVAINALLKEYWNEDAGTWKEPVPGISEPTPYEKIYLTKR